MALRLVQRQGHKTVPVTSEWVSQQASARAIFNALVAQQQPDLQGKLGRVWIERRDASASSSMMAIYSAPQHVDPEQTLAAGLAANETLCFAVVEDAPPFVPESKHPAGGRFFQTQQEFMAYLQTNC
jgi:hypothetical protein